MITDISLRSHPGAHAWEDVRLMIAEFAVDDPDDDLGEDTTAICRTIERDGMIAVDGGLFDDE